MLTSECTDNCNILNLLDKKNIPSLTFKILENVLSNHIVIKLHKIQITTESNYSCNLFFVMKIKN